VCLCLCLCLCLCAWVCVWLSVSLYRCISLFYLCLLSTSLPVSVSGSVSACMFFCTSVCLSICVHVPVGARISGSVCQCGLLAIRDNDCLKVHVLDWRTLLEVPRSAIAPTPAQAPNTQTEGRVLTLPQHVCATLRAAESEAQWFNSARAREESTGFPSSADTERFSRAAAASPRCCTSTSPMCL